MHHQIEYFISQFQPLDFQTNLLIQEEHFQKDCQVVTIVNFAKIDYQRDCQLVKLHCLRKENLVVVTKLDLQIMSLLVSVAAAVVVNFQRD